MGKSSRELALSGAVVVAAALAITALFPGTRPLTDSDRTSIAGVSASYLTTQARRLTTSANPASDYRAADVHMTMRSVGGSHDKATATVHEVTSLWYARPGPDGLATTAYAVDRVLSLSRDARGWRVTKAVVSDGQRPPSVPGSDPRA